jgi:hypothetical protein
MAKEPDFRALCAKLMDRWTKGKDYWSVLAEIQGALAYDPRNDPEYNSYEYATEPIPGDTTWATPKTEEKDDGRRISGIPPTHISAIPPSS